MPDPQVKAGPAKALRAMFAGIGSLLSVTDKTRSKRRAAQPAAAAPETKTGADTPATPEAAVTPEPAIVPEAPEAPDEVARTVAEPESTIAPEEIATLVAEPEPKPALPLANYDDLSLASLRARLRNLSVEQLTLLLQYEKTHATRTDVITMFERRIVKIEAES